MSDRDKYHGQRLKAKDVLRLYAAGERDFRGTILRGCNFRGAELSGADFGKADLQSTNFSNATLKHTKFSHARCGLSTYWDFFKKALIVLVNFFNGLLFCFMGDLLWQTARVQEESISFADKFHLLLENAGITLTDADFVELTLQIEREFGTVPRATLPFWYHTLLYCFVALTFLTLLRGGSTKWLLVAFALTLFTFSTFLSTFTASSLAIPLLYSSVAAIAVSLAMVFVVLSAVIVSNAAFAWVATVAVSFGYAVGTLYYRYSLLTPADISLVAAIGSVWLATYNIRQIQSGNPRFQSLRILSVASTSIGGTNFQGADLSNATFAYARLRSTNFSNSILNHVRWHQAEGLHRARLSTGNLQDAEIRDLLVTLNGIDQDLSDANLSNVNLAGAKLSRANLRGANLNGATLETAELCEANLSVTSCIGTNFTGASFTGACLGSWNIDDTTDLKDIDCQYIFLGEDPGQKGYQERRPYDSNKEFQAGDFEKFFKEALNTVQILIRNGIDPLAFKAAFNKVMAENPGITQESIKAIEKQGDDVRLTLQVPEGTDKAKVERTWDEGYQVGLQEAESRYQALLETKDQQIAEYRGDKDSLYSLAMAMANRPVTVDVKAIAESKSMQGNDHSHNLSISGDFNATNSNVSFNLGEMSGQVSYQINQLPDAAPSANQRSLKDLLTELQAAIEAETELSDVEKKEALGEVGKLAEAGTKPQDNAMQRMAKRAAANLKAITEPLTEASNLVTVCQSLLPLILAVF